MSESTLTSNKSLPGLPTAKAALEGNSFPLFQFFWSPDKKSRWQMQRPFKVMSLWLWFLSQQTIFTWLSIHLDEQILNYLGIKRRRSSAFPWGEWCFSSMWQVVYVAFLWLPLQRGAVNLWVCSQLNKQKHSFTSSLSLKGSFLFNEHSYLTEKTQKRGRLLKCHGSHAVVLRTGHDLYLWNSKIGK